MFHHEISTYISFPALPRVPIHIHSVAYSDNRTSRRNIKELQAAGSHRKVASEVQCQSLRARCLQTRLQQLRNTDPRFLPFFSFLTSLSPSLPLLPLRAQSRRSQRIEAGGQRSLRQVGPRLDQGQVHAAELGACCYHSTITLDSHAQGCGRNCILSSLDPSFQLATCADAGCYFSRNICARCISLFVFKVAD